MVLVVIVLGKASLCFYEVLRHSPRLMFHSVSVKIASYFTMMLVLHAVTHSQAALITVFYEVFYCPLAPF